MAEFRRRPFQENGYRNELAKQRRSLAAQYSGRYAALPTEQNNDEPELQEEGFVASFTKGLAHDKFGQLRNGDDYVALVNQINQQDAENFDRIPRGISTTHPVLTRLKDGSATGDDIFWRGWESPRAGHYFDLQGPDADSVSMPPAPELGSEELIAEMAEVYALALIRDIPFSQINDQSGVDSTTGIAVSDVMNAMSGLSWFTDNASGGLTLQQRRRRAARRVDHGSGYSIDNPPDTAVFSESDAFRGSAPGAKTGPYVSQFMLQGNKLTPSVGNVVDSSISYGRQVIDQKIETFVAGSDYLLHWNALVDVQNGADFGAQNSKAIQTQRRFITTPRDLATYVRYDALYQAYLNACLFMLEDSRFNFQQPVVNPYSKIRGPGFPDGLSSSDGPASRQAFAAFGGPHILSMVTEVATRCLKAVRRQKFNYHRRARPERIGALLTLKGTENNPGAGNDVSGNLGGISSSALGSMLSDSNLGPLLNLIDAHNTSRLNADGAADPHLDFSANPDPDWYDNAAKYLLPMAFAEGSPMHPSYGAGHATVAGGCVTMLKAFFNTTDDAGKSLAWPEGMRTLQATVDGSELEDVPESLATGMTINGELNKLAANISIARNMAGVHYYTDYYESLRMGERIATGMLIEQMKQYNEPVEFSFESFDGDTVHIVKIDYDFADPRVFIHDSDGVEVGLDAWWQRHVEAEPAPGALNFASSTGLNGHIAVKPLTA